MAVRPHNIHDGGIVERRLRPIYEWLDNGNNKKALQEAEKVLKKAPTLQSARALKALALLRLSKTSEAMAVLDTLAEEKPSDDTTLQAMTISFRESQQLERVCQLYEAAVKIEPLSEELHSHLFMSYVRVGDYRSQQRAAMALYKFAPKNPYYFWAVMSIVLQAKSEKDKAKKNILLSLARRMVDNFITENKMEAEQEARLFIMILELQENWEDILKFIETPLYCRLIQNNNTSQVSMPYLRKLGRWRKLNIQCKDLLLDNQDRWDYYVPYFDSVFELMKLGKSEENNESENSVDETSENSVDETAEKCHEFLCNLVETISTGKPMRGPYLARLELWKRLAAVGDPTVLLGSGVALLVQYLRVFAHKPCAIPDIRPYIEMLSKQEREENAREFLTCFGFDENSTPETSDDIQRHVNCVGAWRLCAAPLQAAACLQLATSLRDNYLRCLRRRLVTSTPTEFCAADSYGLLAAHHYFYAAQEQKSSAPLIDALSLLELVLAKSPANFHAKLLLIKIYHVLGNALAADAIYQRLEVKHVQLISLGWVHAGRLLPALALPRAAHLLADTRAFHAHHAKDSVEHLTYAYKYGTFEKLVSLMCLWSRVRACSWSALAARERALLALAPAAPAAPVAPAAPAAAAPLSPLPDELEDNRDLSVVVSWEPPQPPPASPTSPTPPTPPTPATSPQRSAAQEAAYLRLKDALVSCVTLCSELADTRSADEKQQQHKELKTCVEAFTDAMTMCQQKYSEKETISISTPFPSRIIAFVNAPVLYRDLYASMFNMFADLCVNELPDAHKSIDKVVQQVDRSVAQLTEELAERFSDADAGWVMREALEDMSNYLEYIGILTHIVGQCYELITPTNTKKPKKKTNQSPDEMRTADLLKKLNETVQSCITTLLNVFELWPQYNISPTLSAAYDNLKFEEDYQCPVENRLRQGLKDVVADVKNILTKRSKYLKALIP